MLAMKNVLSEQDRVGTMVFDEVDTGVSGRAAQKVAEKMARISRTKQVLCVTHLPQLAAMADTHFSVEKGVTDGRTFTHVRRLDRAQRRQELARLTGGAHITPPCWRGGGAAVCGGGFQAYAGIGLDKPADTPYNVLTATTKATARKGTSNSACCLPREPLSGEKRRGASLRIHPGAAVPTPFRGQ